MIKNNLFVYGTLLVPAVMEAVTGKKYRSDRASLTGFARYRIKDQVYPGITHDEKRTVDGAVYFDIDPPVLKRLDEFESYVYQRREVEIGLQDELDIRAWVYVVADEYKHLLSYQGWDIEEFKLKHLNLYLKQI